MTPLHDYCGCCGRPIPVGFAYLGREVYWCQDCAKHVNMGAETPDQATYFAQYRAPCPFEGSMCPSDSLEDEPVEDDADGPDEQWLPTWEPSAPQDWKR